MTSVFVNAMSFEMFQGIKRDASAERRRMMCSTTRS